MTIDTVNLLCVVDSRMGAFLESFGCYPIAHAVTLKRVTLCLRVRLEASTVVAGVDGDRTPDVRCCEISLALTGSTDALHCLHCLAHAYAPRAMIGLRTKPLVSYRACPFACKATT